MNKKVLKIVRFGFMFTSMIVSPIIVFIFGGIYIQKKFNLPEVFIAICAIFSIVFIIVNFVVFVLKMTSSKQNTKRNLGEKDEIE